MSDTTNSILDTPINMLNHDAFINQLFCGDCIDIMKKLPEELVQRCIQFYRYQYHLMENMYQQNVYKL